MTQTTDRTYGVYALTFHGLAMKDIAEIGWVYDVKWTFDRSAHRDRVFSPDHSPLLFRADEADGIKLEVRPMLDGEPLAGVLVPTTLRGDLTLDANGRVRLTTRVAHEALEGVGMSSAVFLNAGFALECTVSDQPTLEESIQQELAAGQEGPGPLFEDAPAAPEAPVPSEAEPAAPGNLALDPVQPGEDLPFPVGTA